MLLQSTAGSAMETCEPGMAACIWLHRSIMNWVKAALFEALMPSKSMFTPSAFRCWTREIMVLMKFCREVGLFKNVVWLLNSVAQRFTLHPAFCALVTAPLVSQLWMVV